MMPIPVSWVMRLPRGLREQPGWVFIGMMIALVGLGFATGFASSVVQLTIGGFGLQLWGGFLVLTGSLVAYSTWVARPALEKMSLRWLVFALIAYSLWLMVQVPVTVGAMTYTLAFILVVLAEIRVGFLKLILSGMDRYEQPTIKDSGDGDVRT